MFADDAMESTVHDTVRVSVPVDCAEDNSSFIAQARNDCLMARLDSWKCVRMDQNPLFVILDIGCTRAMGSRQAVGSFARVAQPPGIWCEFLPTHAVSLLPTGRNP